LVALRRLRDLDLKEGLGNVVSLRGFLNPEGGLS